MSAARRLDASFQPIRFPLGEIVQTIGAAAALASAGMSAGALAARHQTGDWGDLCAEDRVANEWALRHGARLLSAYELPTGVQLWVITEWDRSATTLLLPEEY